MTEQEYLQRRDAIEAEQARLRRKENKLRAIADEILAFVESMERRHEDNHAFFDIRMARTKVWHEALDSSNQHTNLTFAAGRLLKEYLATQEP